MIVIRKLSFLSLGALAIFSHIPQIGAIGYQGLKVAKLVENAICFQLIISQDVAQRGVAGRGQKKFFARGGFIEKITTFVDVLSLEH